MNQDVLQDVAFAYTIPPFGRRLAGLVCTGYGSAGNCREGGDRHDVDDYAVVYVSAGSGRLETSSVASPIAIEEGHLLWIFPGESFACVPGEGGCSVQWATFTGPMAHSFESLGWLSRAHPVVRPDESAQVGALFHQLRADFSGSSPLAGLLGAALIHRLAVVAYGTRNSAATNVGPRGTALPRAVALIQAGALRPLNLHAVADECGIGYSTLRRQFTRLTGQSISQYLVRVRLDRAKDLLAHTRSSVAEVAEAVGFADPYYFSRVFHHKEGLTPTAFRAQAQRSE